MISLNSYAFAEVDSKWKEMVKLRAKCLRLGVSVPSEVDDYLNIGNIGVDKCPPHRPKCCGQRIISTGVNLVEMDLNVDWVTKGVLITLDEVQSEADYILLMDANWNNRGFV